MTRIILNPRAGRGCARGIEELLRKHIAQPGREHWSLVLTERPGHATDLARQAAEEGVGFVVAAGGDGTVHEVLAGLLGGPVALGVLPVGTGNDFARMLPCGTNLAAALELIERGNPTPTDVGLANGMPFLNVAGCGFDARVAQRINRGIRFAKGTAAYMVAILQELASYRATELTIVTKQETIQTRAMLCAVANARSYGGGLKIAPAATIDDGLLDLTVVQEIGKLDFLRTLPQVFSGKHVHHPRYFTRSVTQVSIVSDPPLPVLIDGEVVGTTPLEVSILSDAIRIVR